MGRPKLLLPWGATSVLGHLIEQWQKLETQQIAVVCATGDAVIPAELDRLEFPAADRILNPASERGMFSSIQCAARWRGWNPDLTHWAIVLGDQPHLSLAILRQVLAFSATHPAQPCQPRQGGHRRHPVVLSRPVFKSLPDSTAPDLKEFLGQWEIAFCELEDEALALDLDRPEDYERAVRLYLGLEKKE